MKSSSPTPAMEPLTVTVPAPLLHRVEILLYDPETKRRAYGKLSAIITDALIDWLKQQEQQQ